MANRNKPESERMRGHLITMPDKTWVKLCELASSKGVSNSSLIRELITNEANKEKPNA